MNFLSKENKNIGNSFSVSRFGGPRSDQAKKILVNDKEISTDLMSWNWSSLVTQTEAGGEVRDDQEPVPFG